MAQNDTQCEHKIDDKRIEDNVKVATRGKEPTQQLYSFYQI